MNTNKNLIFCLLFFALSSPLHAPEYKRAKGKQHLKGIRRIAQVSSFTLRESSPTKIFTPNGDGINDTFNLTFDNPSANIISQAKIYDLTGVEVADFKEETPSGNDPTKLSWDGRDKNGNYVRSGIYIYQVQSEGKVINGTMVVAR